MKNCFLGLKYCVRHTTMDDLPRVMQIYNYARQLMRQNDNPHQWGDTYPSVEVIEEDIRQLQSYLCINADGEILAVFCFFQGKEDPTYRKIYQGEWLNSRSYGVIHRIATSGKQKGIAGIIFDWCSRQIINLRIDTHRDNRAMQHILQKYQFQYCGIIYLKDGAERLAYQRAENG